MPECAIYGGLCVRIQRPVCVPCCPLSTSVWHCFTVLYLPWNSFVKKLQWGFGITFVSFVCCEKSDTWSQHDLFLLAVGRRPIARRQSPLSKPLYFATVFPHSTSLPCGVRLYAGCEYSLCAVLPIYYFFPHARACVFNHFRSIFWRVPLQTPDNISQDGILMFSVRQKIFLFHGVCIPSFPLAQLCMYTAHFIFPQLSFWLILILLSMTYSYIFQQMCSCFCSAALLFIYLFLTSRTWCVGALSTGSVSCELKRILFKYMCCLYHILFRYSPTLFFCVCACELWMCFFIVIFTLFLAHL